MSGLAQSLTRAGDDANAASGVDHSADFLAVDEDVHRVMIAQTEGAQSLALVGVHASTTRCCHIPAALLPIAMAAVESDCHDALAHMSKMSWVSLSSPGRRVEGEKQQRDGNMRLVHRMQFRRPCERRRYCNVQGTLPCFRDRVSDGGAVAVDNGG